MRMPFEEIFLLLAGQSPTVAVLIVGAVILYQQQQIKSSIKVLNHNSSSMLKALLAHKLLKPEDVKDVDV